MSSHRSETSAVGMTGRCSSPWRRRSTWARSPLSSLRRSSPRLRTISGSTVPVVGQVASARLLVGAVLGLLIGPLADAYGHRRLMVVGLIAAAVTPLGIGLASSFPVLLLTAIPGGPSGGVVDGLDARGGGQRLLWSGKAPGNRDVVRYPGGDGHRRRPAVDGPRRRCRLAAVFILCGFFAALAILPVARPLPVVAGHRPVPRCADDAKRLRSVCCGTGRRPGSTP